MANPFKKAAESIGSPLQKKAGYHGAAGGRLFLDWNAGNFSADYEARGATRTLRARARQLVRDNAYAKAFVNELAMNVVGPGGIRLRPSVETTSGNPHKPTNKVIEDAFADWGCPEYASVDGHDSWLDLQTLLIKAIAVDGEALVRKRKYYDNPHGFALQILDADQLDDFYVRLPGKGVNEIRQGVEIDEYGRPVAYHIWQRHPSDAGQRFREVVPADEIYHLFVRDRPNQNRGITWFAPVLVSIKMHDGLSEAELVASRASAAKMGFIVTKNPDMAVSTTDPDDINPERLMEAAAGTIEELGPGQEIQTFDPQHPTAAFKDFTKVILRGVAKGLGISYTGLTGDLEGVNYSSIRAGMLSERDNYRMLQGWYSTQLHRRVYGDWVRMALLTGALRTDSRLAIDFKTVVWKPRGWAWVDPLKDVQAAVLAIEYGFDSRIEKLDDEGRDIDETFSNLAKEEALAKEYDIEISPAGSIRAPLKVEGDETGQGAAPTKGGDSASALSLVVEQPPFHPTINVAPARAPVITVTPPNVVVNVTVPEGAKTRKRVTSVTNARGETIGYELTEIEQKRA